MFHRTVGIIHKQLTIMIKRKEIATALKVYQSLALVRWKAVVLTLNYTVALPGLANFSYTAVF